MTLKNNRPSLLSNIKLCASFHNHMQIKTEVTVRKRLNWFLTFVTLAFYLWIWSFAWSSLLSLEITPVNFMMIRWLEHCEKGVADGRSNGQTDGQTDGQKCSHSCLIPTKNMQRTMCMIYSPMRFLQLWNMFYLLLTYVPMPCIPLLIIIFFPLKYMDISKAC